MEYRALISARCSVRSYRPDPIPRAQLEAVLEAARLAPTAANRQPFRLHVLPTEAHGELLGRLYRAPWFLEAPWVIGITALPGRAWARRDGVSYAWVDASLAFDHLILAAADLGLGTCWVGAFDPQVARALLALDETEEPVAFTPLGFPRGEPRPKQRKPLSELVVWR